jgi:hypothetical protein
VVVGDAVEFPINLRLSVTLKQSCENAPVRQCMPAITKGCSKYQMGNSRGSNRRAVPIAKAVEEKVNNEATVVINHAHSCVCDHREC